MARRVPQAILCRIAKGRNVATALLLRALREWAQSPTAALQSLAICPIFPADCALPSAIVPTLNHTYLWDRTLGTRPLRCRMARLRAYKRKGNRQISPSIGAQQSKLQSQKRPSHLLSN